MLWNCRVLWPRCSRFLFNSYRGYADIVLRDPSRSTTKILVSREGTTQGCPLATLAYAIAILLLIQQLKNPTLHTQNLFVDDSACSGLLINIRRWFDRLLTEGPSYGYFAEPLKSTLVVKEEHMEKVREMLPTTTSTSCWQVGSLEDALATRKALRSTSWTRWMIG